ncbi:MAG: hypothetical protein K2Q03_10515 [Sphingobacteriaceae bacterium]|nr:hypothetical protein [Sphingobacteriaceae bacterium]
MTLSLILLIILTIAFFSFFCIFTYRAVVAVRKKESINTYECNIGGFSSLLGAIIFATLASADYQDCKLQIEIEKQPNYINSPKMKAELSSWFDAVRQSNQNCQVVTLNNNCSAYLISVDFTTLTSQQLQFLSNNTYFTALCSVGFDNESFYQSFPKYVYNKHYRSFSVLAILDKSARLETSRDMVMTVFKDQFTKNCNTLYNFKNNSSSPIKD